MRRTWLRVLWVLLMGSAETVGATEYTNAINNGSWRAVSSVTECRLEQSVPFFGEAVFRTRAGEASGMYLRARTARFEAGEARLVARSPVWMNRQEERQLGTVAIKRGKRPLWVGAREAELLLSQLSGGFEVEVVNDGWYQPEPDQPVTLSMTSIGFRAEYRKYLNCLTSLLPANFDQLKRTALYFPTGRPNPEDEPTASVVTRLDRILQLVKHDSTIRHFYIDGHTDSVGDRDDNLELSRVRAEQVANYLRKRGVPDDWITLRWHGERYPVATNATAGGRAKNRRVTVRIERVEQVEVLPLASNDK